MHQLAHLARRKINIVAAVVMDEKAVTVAMTLHATVITGMCVTRQYSCDDC
jgi:hypothetical protein